MPIQKFLTGVLRMNYCSTVTPADLEEDGRLCRCQYERFRIDEILQRILNGGGHDLPIPNDLSESFTVESDEWAQWMEYQLTLKRVFARAI